MRKYKDIELWSNVHEEEWSDWHWQMQNSITTLEQLEKVICLSADERKGVELATQYLKMKISPHIITLMDPIYTNDPLRIQFVPSEKELDSIDDEGLFSDVNADDEYSPTKGLVHRYPSKVLLFPSNYCGAYCRYCFRRKLSREFEDTLTKRNIENIINYVRSHSQIEEVIFSGGDPLVLGDENINSILNHLSNIEHIKIIRFHTRLPVTIPFRITDELIDIFNKLTYYN